MFDKLDYDDMITYVVWAFRIAVFSAGFCLGASLVWWFLG